MSLHNPDHLDHVLQVPVCIYACIGDYDFFVTVLLHSVSSESIWLQHCFTKWFCTIQLRSSFDLKITLPQLPQFLPGQGGGAEQGEETKK